MTVPKFSLVFLGSLGEIGGPVKVSRQVVLGTLAIPKYVKV